jgi:hypothetical protein
LRQVGEFRIASAIFPKGALLAVHDDGKPAGFDCRATTNALGLGAGGGGDARR